MFPIAYDETWSPSYLKLKKVPLSGAASPYRPLQGVPPRAALILNPLHGGGGGGGWGYSREFWIGVCREGSLTLTLSKD